MSTTFCLLDRRPFWVTYRKRRGAAGELQGVAEVPEPVSPDYRSRVLRLSHTWRSHSVKHLPEPYNAIDGVHCRVPNVTFYLYPDVAEAMARKGFTDYEVFRRAVLAETGVSMCSRTHFGHELPGERGRHLRFAYSGIEADQIEEGLDKLRVFLES